MNHTSTMHPGVSLRPMNDADQPFLSRLYDSIREPELVGVDWTEEDRRRFLDLQFQAQHHHYIKYYETADFDIIEQDGQSIGRLYVDRGASEIRIMDIALMPEVRGQGLGTRLLEELIAEAAADARKLTIHVEKQNPALQLYLRLGFQPIRERDVYLLLSWSPTHSCEQVSA